ncbi:hypothetical protein HYU94_00170 [Candidatus Daviesbacteria bacterium]|nr:hypothetical protein [Candidatus Daviesbacteria bacterium]
MSRIFFFLLLFAFSYWLFTAPIFAQDATNGATRKPALKPAAIQQKINVRQDKVDNRIAVLQEKQASRTAALKAKLEKFKDRKKAEVAERVNTNLNKINQNQTSQMKKHLNTMSAILDKLEAKNPAKALAAIESARNTIATTSAAVQAQAEKDYTIQISSESKVRLDAKAQRDKLHKDLQETRKLVRDAKRSVSDAIREAKSGPKEATESGQ